MSDLLLSLFWLAMSLLVGLLAAGTVRTLGPVKSEENDK